MGCCNQAPNGGSQDIKLVIKVFAIVAIVIALVVIIWG